MNSIHTEWSESKEEKLLIIGTSWYSLKDKREMLKRNGCRLEQNLYRSIMYH